MKATELKSDIHSLVDSTNDSTILNLIYSILSKFKRATRNTVILTDMEKKAIDKALKSVKSGNVIDHEKVMAEMKKKYPSLVK
jgi:hypothetical protein